MFSFNMSSLCQPSSQSNKKVCSTAVHGCRVCGQFAPYAKAGYSSVQGAGGWAGSHRFSPAVVAPYGTPLKVSTPPSTNPRTLPYCVFATAVRGVDRFPASWCEPVFTLSEPNADLLNAAPKPAVVDSSSASRRVRRTACFKLAMNTSCSRVQSIALKFRDSLAAARSSLFRQRVLAINVELAYNDWPSRIQVAAANADGVFALGDDRISILRHHPHVAGLQVKVHLLAGAGLEMHALKPAKRDARRSFDIGELQIELNDLVAGQLARVRHGHIRANGLSSSNGLRWDTEIAVTEFRIAQSVPKWVKGLTGEVAIRTIRHAVILEVR